MPRGMSRLELVRLARAVAAAMFERLRRLTPSAIEKARNKAFEVIHTADPTTGTANHPFAAYSHGIAALAAEGVALAERAWVPAKEIRRGTWAKAGKKLVSSDKRFTIMKSSRGYDLLDLDTYNEYPAASQQEAKELAARLSRETH